MVEIYTAPSCRSCAKAVKWLKDYHIPFIDKKLNQAIAEKGELERILENSELGFESIISMRSDGYKKLGVDFNKLKLADAIELISKNPSIVRRPIILDKEHGNMQVGYNKEDIEIFQLAADHDWKKCPLKPDACHALVVKNTLNKLKVK